jgi:predicted SnoaL-like aldol condensation-catalyzing enzyme
MMFRVVLMGLLFVVHVVKADESLHANKQLVVDFYNNVILQARHNQLDQYVGATYIQHNPSLADGKEALRDLLKRINPESTPKAPSGEIVRVIAEGDLVVLHVKYYHWPTERGGAVMDIFRIDNGKITEHWDVLQAVPETAANENTMF